MAERIVDQLRKALEDEIVTGRLPQGSRLDEVALATRFSVSRTPIREALHQLSSSGLVELKPRRGAFVTSVTMETLVEMFETMAEMEAVCGRLATRRMHEDERKALLEAHDACCQAAATEDVDLYYDMNVAFHRTIYMGSHNRFLADEARRLRRRLQAYRRLQLRVRGRVSASAEEHGLIVEAILAGDEKGAETALRAHVMIQGERFGDLLMTLDTIRQSTALTEA
ncbi:MAG: GntR family transcriptional regulator [Rhodospirillales bacterium]|nr:GntR family transcriptional regulator [Rhodospirillales bacterium]